MSSRDDLAECYRILELDTGATPEEVKRAWRDLTKVWHPDRFKGDSRLEQKAEERLKAINEAYGRLTDAAAPGRAAESRPAATSVSHQPPAPECPHATDPDVIQRSSRSPLTYGIVAAITIAVLLGARVLRFPKRQPPTLPAPDVVDISRLRWEYRIEFDPLGKPHFKARVHNQTTCSIRSVTVSFADQSGDKKRYLLPCGGEFFRSFGIGSDSVGDCHAEVLGAPLAGQLPEIVAAEADILTCPPPEE